MMNRRESIRALTLGTIGAAVPAPVLTAATLSGKEADDKPRSTDPSHFASNFSNSGKFLLLASRTLLDLIRAGLPQGIDCIDIDHFDSRQLIDTLASGATMLWIGSADRLPKELSLGSFALSNEPLELRPAEAAPLDLGGVTLSKTVVASAYIAPPKEMPLHNIDEEVRADFLPLLVAYDRFGNPVGYPAALMSYYAPSLAGGRFKGSECFVFFSESPLNLTSPDGWKKIIASCFARMQSGLQVKNCTTNYASISFGERIQVMVSLQNSREKAVWSRLRFYVQSPADNQYKPITEMRRVAAGRSETEAVCDFLPAANKNGLWKIRVEIWQDVNEAEKLTSGSDHLQLIDRRDIGFVMLDKQVKTPEIIRIEGTEIIVDGERGFFAGTHYYPSTSWWEWVWRDFRPLKAEEDFAAIRKAGYRLVRIWIDPVLDEQVLRAMDAAIALAALHGIVLDICIFTQWVRYIGFERKSGEQLTFEFRHPSDFNVVSFSLRNLALQKEYAAILGERWKAAGNIFYNLANEAYIKDPDDTQMDAAARAWPENKWQKGQRRDTALFVRWAKEITDALRRAGAAQPVMPGYMFSTLDGGDVYLGNRDWPLLPWHSYLPTRQTASTIQYFDPFSSGRPLLLEEFGRLGWNNIQVYEENVHYALAAGAAGAMSYEWGVSWLSRESCFWPIPLLEACVENPDPRWFKPYTTLKETWSEYGVGLCATPSGTGYGSIYHGTPFPAEAAVALGRLALMGQGLQRGRQPEQVYVIIPSTRTSALEKIQPVFEALWRQKKIFGTWQEEDLDSLPSTVKAVICPVHIGYDLSKLRARGIQVFEGEESWRSCTAFEQLEMSGGADMDLLTRRTVSGLLCTLVNGADPGNVAIRYKGAEVRLTVHDFGMVHFTANGISLIEGSGRITVNNKTYFHIEKGRAIISMGKNEWKLMVNEPTTIRFPKRISGLAISDGSGTKRKISQYKTQQQVLEIDDQLAKYVIHVV